MARTGPLVESTAPPHIVIVATASILVLVSGHYTEHGMMKQPPAAKAVASAISLLDQYLVEDGKRSKAGLNQYIEWLRRHGRQELADLIWDNANVADSLRALMEQHRV